MGTRILQYMIFVFRLQLTVVYIHVGAKLSLQSPEFLKLLQFNQVRDEPDFVASTFMQFHYFKLITH